MHFGDRAIALAIGAICALAYLAAGAGLATDYDYYGRLADAILHGRWFLEEAPSWLNELLPCGDGRFCVAYPPLPAILALPFAAFVPTAVAQVVASGSRLSRRAPFEDRLPARAGAGRRRWPSLRRHLRGIRPSPLGHAARRRICATYRGRRVLQPRALLAGLFAPTALRDLSRATRPRRGNALLPASTVHRHEPLPHDPGAHLDLRRLSPGAAG